MKSKFYKQQNFQNFWENDPDVREHLQFETAIMSRRSKAQSFLLDGYCKVCDKPTTFLVDRLFVAQETPQGWTPNWRERLVCRHCKLNNRQRTILHAIKDTIATRADNEHSISLYAMEQITPLFAWLNQHFDNVTGSEYLGEEIEG